MGTVLDSFRRTTTHCLARTHARTHTLLGPQRSSGKQYQLHHSSPISVSRSRSYILLVSLSVCVCFAFRSFPPTRIGTRATDLLPALPNASSIPVTRSRGLPFFHFLFKFPLPRPLEHAGWRGETQSKLGRCDIIINYDHEKFVFLFLLGFLSIATSLNSIKRQK